MNLAARCFLFAMLVAGAGANIARAQTCYIHPFSRVSDPYGCCRSGCPRYCDRDNFHRGTDYFHANDNQPVPAVADGTVVSTGWVGQLGNTVQVRHTDGMYTTSCHLSAIHVSPGQVVSRGQTVGLQGETGYAFGEHVHLVMSTVSGAGPGGPTQDAYAYIQSHLVCRPDRDGDGSYEGDDCDDNDANRRPGRAETCDNQDNDCDPRIDEGLMRGCGSDVGECMRGEQTCARGDWGVCAGEVTPTDESCDLRDNNCDGAIDDQRICEHEDAAQASSLFSRVASDVDGDGRADACVRTPAGFECLTTAPFGFDRTVRGPALRDEDGWDTRAIYTSLRMGDVDGDGMDDLCIRSADRIVCWAASGVGFDESLTTMPLGEASPSAQHAEIWLADIDGDAQVDVCARGVDGLRCQPSRGGGLRTLRALSDAEGFDDVGRHGSIRFGDVNGDGSDDVCARNADGISCWLASDAGFLERIAGPQWSDALGWNEPRYGSTIRLSDVDGDGRVDVCGRGPEGFVCTLADERGFGSTHRGPAMTGEAWDGRDVYTTLRMGDVDGDGASDVCARTSEGVRCWLWTGESFSTLVVGPELSNAAGWDQSARYTSLRLADVDGDARVDLCARASDGLRCWLSEGTHFARQWRESRWNDAIGLTDPSFASTLTIGGVGEESPSHLHGGCACRAQSGASPNRLIGLMLGALALVAARRKRTR